MFSDDFFLHSSNRYIYLGKVIECQYIRSTVAPHSGLNVLGEGVLHPPPTPGLDRVKSQITLAGEH